MMLAGWPTGGCGTSCNLVATSALAFADEQGRGSNGLARQKQQEQDQPQKGHGGRV